MTKEKRIGDFQDFGFRIGFRFSSQLDAKARYNLFDRFTEHKIENNSQQLVGGDGGNEWNGFVALDKSIGSTMDMFSSIRSCYISIGQWEVQ
jgi:uncharacterized protein YggL (DUF469 family)